MKISEKSTSNQDLREPKSIIKSIYKPRNNVCCGHLPNLDEFLEVHSQNSMFKLIPKDSREVYKERRRRQEEQINSSSSSIDSCFSSNSTNSSKESSCCCCSCCSRSTNGNRRRQTWSSRTRTRRVARKSRRRWRTPPSRSSLYSSAVSCSCSRCNFEY